MISIWCNEIHSIILLVYFFVSNQRPTNFSWNWFIPLIFHEFFLPLNCKQCHQILAHPLSYCWRICQNSTAEGRKFFFWQNCFIPIFHNNFVKYKTKIQFHEFFFWPPDTYLAHDKHIHIVGVGWYDHIICHKTLFFVKSHKFMNLCVFTNFW